MASAVVSESHEVDPAVFRRYITTAVSAGVAILLIPTATGLPVEPFILLVAFGPMLGGAATALHRSGVPARALFNGALKWRFGWGRWLFVASGIPVATVTVAALTGTFVAPPEGWGATFGAYSISTFVVGTLVLNLWEEVVWQGMVQRHLTGRFGAAKGVLLTALPFAMLHVPLAFTGDVSLPQALVATVLLFVLAAPFRYLLGRIDQITGGSLLAVAILHASFNASGALDVIAGGWQHIAAVVAVAGVVLASQRRQERRDRLSPGSSPRSELSSQGAFGGTTHGHTGRDLGRWGTIDAPAQARIGRRAEN